MVKIIAKRILIGVGAFIGLVFVIWVASLLLDFFQSSNIGLFSIGSTASRTTIEISWVQDVASVVLGTTPPLTVEKLILFLAIFFIMFFALGEILSIFTIFSGTTSWVIAFGLAIIAGVTKIISVVSFFMAGAAGIGAFGILVIIGTAIVSAVLLHLGIGGAVRKWRLMRQAEITTFKSGKGAIKTSAAIKSLKKIEGALEEGE